MRLFIQDNIKAFIEVGEINKFNRVSAACGKRYGKTVYGRLEKPKPFWCRQKRFNQLVKKGVHSANGYLVYQSKKAGSNPATHRQNGEGMEKCTRCENNAAEPEHSCPYQSEINGDDQYACDCCKECEYNCAMEI